MAKVRPSFIDRVEAAGSEEGDWDSIGQTCSVDRSEERCPWLSGELGGESWMKLTNLGALSCLWESEGSSLVSVSV